MRREYYVYFHRDAAGKIFYVGKGIGQRAWSRDRHVVWHTYVNERLNGIYSVEIHCDGLAELEAETLEDKLISQLGEQLVNWINPRRQFDYQALEMYHGLRNNNRRFLEETKYLESSNLVAAVEKYRIAMARMREYEAMTLERGLVAELGAGPDWGDPHILNRLTICLQRLGRNQEMIEETDRYFADFPSAIKLSVGKQVMGRVEKARIKLAHDNA